ncbi:MAG: protein kinase [Planctomycetia bacterium]|nr:protein kinase [Planctomycetia bacterium]
MPQGQPPVPVVGECDGCGTRVQLGAAGKKTRCAKCGGEVLPISVAGTFAPPKEISSIDLGDLEVGEPGERAAAPVRPAPAKPAAKAAGGMRLGKIQLVKELGRGGMGIVYLGRDEGLRRTLALKVLLAPGDDKLRQRFLREARLVSKLRHPNIVAVHEFGEQDGKAYFTMDFIEGGSLEGRMKAGLGVRELMGIVATVARALDYAHGQGMVHRDVKPQNVLVTPQGVPYLTDFGLAREVESNTRLTVSGSIMGTPAYMSPEQATGGAAVDSRTDIYSLGAVLYEGLTGRPPFDGMDLIALLGAIVNTDPVPPSNVNGNVPADVETICLKALAKQPDRRYQTGAAMADDIERWLRGEAIAARRSGAIEHGVNWLKRRPAVAIGGGAGILALLVIVMIVRNSAANERLLQEQRDAERKAAQRKAQEFEEQLERDRRAAQSKIADLEAQLAKASSPEEQERIRRELASLTTGTTGSGWEGVAKRASGLAAGFDFAGAIAAVESWSEPGDAEKKAAKLKELRESAARHFEAKAKDAAALESGGKLKEAADAWRALERIGVPELAAKARDSRARVEAAIAAAPPPGLPPAVAWLRTAVAARLRARDFDGARALLESAAGAVPDAERAELEWARAGTQAFHDAIRRAFADPKGMKVSVWTSETPVTVTGVSEKGLRVTKDSGALSLVDFADVKAEELARVATEAKVATESIALFWCFWDSPRMGRTAAEKGEARARNRKTASALGVARVSALIEALVAAEAEMGPVEDLSRPFAVETTGAGASQKWTYDFADAGQMRDWVAFPARPEDGTEGWGARAEGGRLRVVNATLGFPAMLETPASLVVQFASVRPADRLVQVWLDGYCCEIRGGVDVALKAPDGREMKTARISPLQAGQPFTVDLRLLDRNFAVVVNGQAPVTADRGPEFATGLTGVASARDAVLEVARIEITGRPDAGSAERWQAYRAYPQALDVRRGTAPPFDGSAPDRLSAWERDAAWQPIPRGLRATSKGTGTEARTSGHRNFRFAFEYCAHAGRAIRLRTRATGDAGLDWLLPADRPGEWRKAEAIAAEGFVWLRIDGLLLVRPVTAPSSADGRFALGVLDGDVSFRNFRVQPLGGVATGDEPPPPWIEAKPVAGPARPPTPEGWTELFDGRTLNNFIKKDKVSVAIAEGAILVEQGELLTSKSWKSAEFEVEFLMDQAGPVSAGLRGSWFAKDEVGPGRHKLWMRNQGDRVEAHVDGRPLAMQKWSPMTSGCAKIKVDGTTAHVTSFRWRAVAEPEVMQEKPPDKPPQPGPDKPPQPGPGPKPPPPGPGPKPPPPGPGPGPKPK